METIVINLYGGPGTGKSTMAAHIFARLKDLGYDAELVTEYAKDMTWQESFNVLSNQIYVFGKQQHRIWRLNGKVDFIITDSPLLNSIVYNKTSNVLDSLVEEEYHKYNNLDVFLNRVKPYNPNGRSQTLEEATEIDGITLSVLGSVRTSTWYDLRVNGHVSSVNLIIDTAVNYYLNNESNKEITQTIQK